MTIKNKILLLIISLGLIASGCVNTANPSPTPTEIQVINNKGDLVNIPIGGGSAPDNDSSYVPYTGATGDVNLGSNNITADYYFGNGSNLTGITTTTNITTSTDTNLTGILTGNGSKVGVVSNTLHTQNTDTQLETTTANIPIGSGYNINFINALSSDHTWSGLTTTSTANATVGLADLCYNMTNGQLNKAKGDSTSTMPAIELATASVTAGTTGTFLLYGFMRDDSWSWTVGGYIYVSHTTAGLLTQTTPTGSGKQVQIVGIALTSHIMLFNPQYVIVGLK